MKNINVFVGQKIQSKRKAHKMAQQDIADGLSLSRVSVVNIEAGRQAISMEHLCRLCVIFKCGPTDFLPPLPKFTAKKITEEKVVVTERTQYEWEDFNFKF